MPVWELTAPAWTEATMLPEDVLDQGLRVPPSNPVFCAGEVFVQVALDEVVVELWRQLEEMFLGINRGWK